MNPFFRHIFYYGRGGETVTEEYQALLDKWTADAVTHPSDAVKNEQNKAINTAKLTITGSGLSVWDETDYIICALHDGDMEASFYNWKNPEHTLVERINSIPWTSNVGFRGIASNNGLVSGFNPATDGLKYTQNNASMGVFLAPDTKPPGAMWSSNVLFGTIDGTRSLLYYYTSNKWQVRFNGNTDINSNFEGFTKKFYGIKRDNTTVTSFMGDETAEGTQASTALVNNRVGVLCRKTVASSDQGSPQTLHFFVAGSKYALEGWKSIMQTYQDAVYSNPISDYSYLAQYDFNDPSTLFADAGKTTPATNGSVIRAVENKNGTWGDLTAIDDTTAPVLRTSIVNSRNVAEWDGTDDNFDFAVGNSELGDQFTIFIVMKNDDATNGSHPVSGENYLAVTGSSYGSNPGGVPYFVVHPDGGAGGQIRLKQVTDGWNVIALRRNGSVYEVWNGNYQKSSGTNANTFQVTDMGTAFSLIGSDWNMDGYIGGVEIFDGFMNDEDVETKLKALNAAYAS